MLWRKRQKAAAGTPLGSPVPGGRRGMQAGKGSLQDGGLRLPSLWPVGTGQGQA